MNDYGSKDYWNQRYLKNISDNINEYEWYVVPKLLIKILQKNNININDKILIVGCGNSKLGEELYNLGYNNYNIYNMDFSDIIIKQQAKIYKDFKMKWFIENIIDCPILSSNKFELIIDKGTLDSIICDSITNYNKALKEIIRLLKPKGIFILISFSNNRIKNNTLNIDIISCKNISTNDDNPIYLYIIQKK